MAATVTITRGTTLPDSAGKTDVHNLIDTASGTVSGITTSDLSGSAGIVGTQLSATAAIADTQLATITTAAKVNTSALTTTSKAAGDILYNDGTNWVRLAKDAGKYLKSGASAASWDTPNAVTPISVQVTGADSINTNSTSYVDVANLTTTQTFTGKPTMVVVHMPYISGSTTNGYGYITLLIDGVAKCVSYINAYNGATQLGAPNVSLFWMETIAAGSKIVKVQWKANAGTITQDGTVAARTMQVFEII